jgi:hypothetical protein
VTKSPRGARPPKQPKHVPDVDRSLGQKPKTPRAHPFRGGSLAWRFSSADRGGPFAWSEIEGRAEIAEVIKKLSFFETMTESEIRDQGSHTIEIDRLSKPARHRLEQIKLDDLDEVMSFRLMGTQRVFCRIDANIMHVLWWDPNHLVCPSIKKHT